MDFGGPLSSRTPATCAADSSVGFSATKTDIIEYFFTFYHVN